MATIITQAELAGNRVPTDERTYHRYAMGMDIAALARDARVHAWTNIVVTDTGELTTEALHDAVDAVSHGTGGAPVFTQGTTTDNVMFSGDIELSNDELEPPKTFGEFLERKYKCPKK